MAPLAPTLLALCFAAPAVNPVPLEFVGDWPAALQTEVRLDLRASLARRDLDERSTGPKEVLLRLEWTEAAVLLTVESDRRRFERVVALDAEEPDDRAFVIALVADELLRSSRRAPPEAEPPAAARALVRPVETATRASRLGVDARPASRHALAIVPQVGTLGQSALSVGGFAEYRWWFARRWALTTGPGVGVLRDARDPRVEGWLAGWRLGGRLDVFRTSAWAVFGQASGELAYGRFASAVDDDTAGGLAVATVGRLGVETRLGERLWLTVAIDAGGYVYAPDVTVAGESALDLGGFLASVGLGLAWRL